MESNNLTSNSLKIRNAVNINKHQRNRERRRKRIGQMQVSKSPSINSTISKKSAGPSIGYNTRFRNSVNICLEKIDAKKHIYHESRKRHKADGSLISIASKRT